ncbi:MAG: hypothetical protein JW917_10450 [Ignavibacteria bacterium]|nr:hypothetical protein [Ignavibacteria bacterium]
MKPFKILLAVFVVALLIGGLMSCGSKDTDNAVKYLTKISEFIASQDFKTSVSGLVDGAIVESTEGEKNFDNAKFSEDFNKILDSKSDEIAKSVGFKDSKDATAIIDKVKDQPVVKDLFEKYDESVKKIRTDMEKEGNTKVEEMKKALEETVKEKTGGDKNVPEDKAGEDVDSDSQP